MLHLHIKRLTSLTYSLMSIFCSTLIIHRGKKTLNTKISINEKNWFAKKQIGLFFENRFYINF